MACTAPVATAASAPDAGRPFEPPPLPPARFDVKPPSADPERQLRIVEAADGTRLYTETWLPAAKDGEAPPARVPVVLVLTIYARPGSPDEDQGWAVPLLVPRGYAVTFAHVRGFGGSGGCYEFMGANEVSDGARIVDDAGSRAPWADGTLGMLGFSNPGGTQFATATGPDRERLAPLRALVAGAPNASLYDTNNHDGVQHMPLGQIQAAAIVVDFHLTRKGCRRDVPPGLADPSGDYTPFYAERDHTRRLDRLEAAVLMFHGHADRTVSSHGQIGLFDNLPAGVPRAGLFGVWDHEYPDNFRSAPTGPRQDWEREDFKALVFAWYERWLRGVEGAVRDWPVAQVQSTDGQWRTASTWPRLPGAPGTLVLGPAGRLGSTAPSGSTAFLELPSFEMELDGTSSEVPGAAAVFTTPPLSRRLEMAGAPELDLWVTLAAPDAHLTAHLEALDSRGRRVTRESRTMGARSAMHLDPLVDGRFRQEAGRPAPVGTPVKVTLRLNPTDLAVPAGGRLRLAVTGSSIAWDGLDAVEPDTLGPVFQGPTLPSLVVQPITILHDCEHRSALRFTFPEPGSELLNVREADESGAPLADNSAAPAAETDGGGLATQTVCP